MPILVSFILLFVLNLEASCRFNDNVKKVSSLAGSVTVVLKEVGLLSDPKLQGISIFNPISSSEFKGRIYPGGVFLSQKELPNFDGQVVFYDEVRDLQRLFSSRKSVVGVQIKTRNLSPMEALLVSIKELRPFTQGCEKEFEVLHVRAQKLEQSILSKIPQNFKAIFYIGEIKSRFPETIMSYDGIVKWLKDQGKLSTYPSELAYVNWSAKVMNSLGKDFLQVGILDTGRDSKKEIKKEKGKVNFSYPGVLVPGYSQLEAFDYFFSAI